MNNLKSLLALNRMSKVGPRLVARLQKRWPDLAELFGLTQRLLEKAGLPPWLAKAISDFDFQRVEEDLNWLSKDKDNHLFGWDCEAYPPLLKEIPDPPLVIYLQGQLSALTKPTLAMVGSRKPSITGSENARQFAKELSAYGITIVSGLALGIDACAHLGCLDASGQTIAVMGTGIDCIYPASHRSLASQITQNGLLISEFPLKSPPTAGHFPRRNRIISGLSLCTLVVEAALKSGSLITARMACEQNRDVLAIPGSIHNPLAHGCHHLLQQGAKLVSCVKDVLDELRIDYQANTKEIAKPSLDNELSNLVQFLGFETTSIDKLISRSGYSIEQVTSELAQLELEGKVRAVAGGYMRCEYEEQFI